MAKSLFEKLGGRYERQGDYLIPCLTVSTEEEQPIGTWGQRHLDYLKQAQGITERLKEESALEWIGRMNNIRACAMEIVNGEIAYK